jgi:hypothetical protein
MKKVARLFAWARAHALLRRPVRDFWPLRGCPTPPRVGNVRPTRGLRHVGMIRHGTGGAYAAHKPARPTRCTRRPAGISMRTWIATPAVWIVTTALRRCSHEDVSYGVRCGPIHHGSVH